MRYRPGRARWGSAGALALLCAALTPPVAARARGIAIDSCSGCHGNPEAPIPELSLRAEPASFGPGDVVAFTLELRGPSVTVGGVFLTTGNVGALRAGDGLSAQGQGLAHSAPKPADGGAVSFNFTWQAPPTPGVVAFAVAALAGNGNGASSGDAPNAGSFEWAYGCEGVPSYVDLDRDGYGAQALGTRLRCAGQPAPVGFADRDGDCDENDEKAHPGGLEICNKKDDDCDGQVDEGASPVELWPDEDGDGFYAVRRGTAKVGCGSVPGYAATGGDCDDLNAEVHPNAPEVCNSRDDDCDGEVDERVRPQCGVGWCSRYSPTCSSSDCRPGPPREETCNAFDDDCDGELDNGVCVAEPAPEPCAPAGCGGQSGGAAPPAGGAPAAPGGRNGAFSAGESGGCALHGPPTWWGLTVLVLFGSVGWRRRRARTSAARAALL